MARPVLHAGGAYTKPLVVKVNDEALEALDRVRGDQSRSAFMRDLLRAELRKRWTPTPK